MCTDQVIKSREFARLKITESLSSLIASKFDNQFSNEKVLDSICHQLLAGLNSKQPDINKKWRNKVDKFSSVIFDIELLKNDGN